MEQRLTYCKARWIAERWKRWAHYMATALQDAIEQVSENLLQLNQGTLFPRSFACSNAAG
jgi:hypothetical protein